MANTTISKPTEEDMRITPERALMIKKALIRQYADQYGLEVTGWTETLNGVTTTVLLKENQEVQSLA